VGNRRVLIDTPYHTYTAEGFAPCASSLLVSNLYNTPNCFCSRYFNIDPFIYFVCFTIYLISRFEMPLPPDSRAPTFWPRAARGNLFNLELFHCVRVIIARVGVAVAQTTLFTHDLRLNPPKCRIRAAVSQMHKSL